MGGISKYKKIEKAKDLKEFLEEVDDDATVIVYRNLGSGCKVENKSVWAELSISKKVLYINVGL